MMKKLFFSMILIISCTIVQAITHTHDDQKQIIEKLMKKLVYAQATGKGYQFIRDEIAIEVAAEFDDSDDIVSDKKSQTILIIGGIAVGCLALGIGGYLWYKHYRSKKQSQRVYGEGQSSENDDIRPMPTVENIPVTPPNVQPEEEMPVQREVFVNRQAQINPLMHDLILNEFFQQFPRNVQAPLREAIRNGSDRNLVNFTNALWYMGQHPRDMMARQRFDHMATQIAQRLTHDQQRSIAFNL